MQYNQEFSFVSTQMTISARTDRIDQERKIIA